MSTLRLVAVSVLTSLSALAIPTATITTGSTFSASTPVTTYSAPSVPWTLTFMVAATPSVTSSTAGQFTTTYSSGVFTLNGTPITLTGGSVTFLNGGGFSMMLDPSTEFLDNSEGTNFFSGTTSSPTMAAGTYSNYTFSIFSTPSGPIDFGNAVNYNVTITGGATPTPSPTPVPPSVILSIIGLACVGGLEVLRRKRLEMR